MDSSVTILLAIKDRFKFTDQFLKFSDSFNKGLNIFIADGSKKKKINKKYLRKFTNLNISYRYFGVDKNYTLFMTKMYKAIKLIKTKYVYFAEDDDFIFKYGVEKSEKFLNKNSSYVSSSGFLIDLEINYIRFIKTFILNFRNQSNGKNFFLKSFNKSNQKKRLIQQFRSDHFTIWNSLHRTRVVETIFKDLSKMKIESYLLTEHFFNYAINLKGKIHRGKFFQYLKIDNILYSSSFDYEQRIGGYEKQFHTNHWNKDLEKTIIQLVNYLKYKNNEKSNYYYYLIKNNLIKRQKKIIFKKKIFEFIKSLIILILNLLKLKKCLKKIFNFLHTRRIDEKLRIKNKKQLSKFINKENVLKNFYTFLKSNKNEFIKNYKL